MKQAFLYTVMLLFASHNYLAQKNLSIKKTKETITVDGLLNEGVWQQESEIVNFVMQYPTDTLKATDATEVWVCYDEENLYIAAKLYDSKPDEPYTSQSLKRDFSFPVNDAFAIFIDPYMTQTNGQSFAVNPFGVQREGMLQNGGGFGVTTAWDNKWFSEVLIGDGFWTLEMKIPFKTLRYTTDNKSWGINFARNNLKLNETTVWNPVPRNFNVAALSYSGVMNWDAKPPKAGMNVSFIPYAIGSVTQNFDDPIDNSPIIKPNLGFDAKIAISSSLNLDITVNPDFSQVDVDRQVTNLSRFSLFFPERRQFFIENSDLFGRFGFSKIRPFFSRRIGLNNGQKVPIIGGLRLSGMINTKWRVGLMNMQTEGGDGYTPENFTVAALKRQVGKASNVGFIFVNRQGFLNDKVNYADYNRIFGLDFDLLSADGKHRGKAFFHKSFAPNLQDFTHASWYMHNTQNLIFHWNHEYVGKDYRADVGFVPRIQNYNSNTGEVIYKSYWRVEPSINYRIYAKGSKVNFFSPGLYFNQYYDDKLKPNESSFIYSFDVSMNDKSKFGVSGATKMVRLYFDTDITFDGNPSHVAKSYYFNDFRVYYRSSRIKPFNYNFTAIYGGYYEGRRLNLKTSVSYRIQPKFNISASVDYNKITFDSLYHDVEFLLISPSINYQFNKKMFFTTFIQFNSQRENININARFQYRFKPMSDLFIVYTDNYDSNIYGIKNRALVVKLVWWLNL